MRGNLVIDGRNALDPEALRAVGLLYEGVGRGDRRDAPRVTDASGAAATGAA
jgi:hypothetical protein